jgi:indolepyruvate ferredoxin oxidoreductase
VLTDEIVSRLAPGNHAVAVELASLPLEIRGFGHIKEANLALAKAKEASLLSRLRAPVTVTTPALAAAE